MFVFQRADTNHIPPPSNYTRAQCDHPGWWLHTAGQGPEHPHLSGGGGDQGEGPAAVGQGGQQDWETATE